MLVCVAEFSESRKNVQKENQGIGNARVVNNSLKLKGQQAPVHLTLPPFLPSQSHGGAIFSAYGHSHEKRVMSCGVMVGPWSIGSIGKRVTQAKLTQPHE
ncbi:unnamed protein product [Sphenostylis stenocarpa]|uniref:Uncharacterized protein n=1 Tax=Sphenostylis stenocarpa TaxID=92480 RepID=A0AA86SH56_9FABA|nr:unnamed protein product [Sphenostylis stenocarpa]